MAQFFNMPQPGSTMEEGTILKWHKAEGDSLKKGDVLLEIETDKATVEVEAESDGVLRKILAGETVTVPVKQPIAIIGSADESIEALLSQLGLGGQAPAQSEKNDLSSASEAPTPASEPSVIPSASSGRAPVPLEGDRVFISPRARRIADANGVPISALAGRASGPENRVIERDVLAYVAERKVAPAKSAPLSEGAERGAPRATPLAARIADDLGLNLSDLSTGLPGSRVRREDVLRHAETTRSAESAPVPVVAAPTEESMTIHPFGGMRKRIADNVAKSAFTAPHVTLTLEVDMTAAGEFRKGIMADVEKAYGTRVSFTDLLVKAAARALGDHPLLNSALVGNEIHLHKHKNIGVAVALEEGLIVPVVKHADRKSLGAVSSELKQLVERARTGKFTPDDLSGGTFTITNLGAFGIDVFDPIIVPPQAAILGVGRIADKPVVVNKEIVVRSMMNLCLSFDHRLVDGVPAAKFLQRLKELLESPLLVLI